MLKARARWFPPVMVFGVALGTALFMQAGLNQRLRSLDTPLIQPAAEFQRHWDSRIFKILTFGHLQSVADWFWLKALIDPSLDKVPVGVHPPFYYVVDFLTDLDPAFFEAYYVGANILSVVRDDGPGARDLLLKARKFGETELGSYPEAFQKRQWEGRWNLSMMLAYVYLFDLHDMPSAALAFQEAAAQPGAPLYLQQLSERFKVPGGQYDVGIRLLQFLSDESQDARTKEKFQRQRRALYISQYLFDLNRSFREFLGRRAAYRSNAQPSPEKMRKFWLEYMKESRNSHQDPWGGTLSLDVTGRIVTTTPHEKVLGLD